MWSVAWKGQVGTRSLLEAIVVLKEHGDTRTKGSLELMRSCQVLCLISKSPQQVCCWTGCVQVEEWH